MNDSSFDRMTWAIGQAVSRRRMLGVVAAAVAAGFMSGAGRRSATLGAQEGVPAATPVVGSGLCMQYIISGGPLPTDAIHVDDDLTVLLNDHVIFQDSDGLPGVMPPILFQAENGDQLTVVARDEAACGRKIGSLWLHCATGGTPRFLTAGQDDGCVEERAVPQNFYRESWRV